jgi:hypothetical protein
MNTPRFTKRYADNVVGPVSVRIFTYKINKGMEKLITHIEKYIQTPTLVIITMYFMCHLVKAWLG